MTERTERMMGLLLAGSFFACLSATSALIYEKKVRVAADYAHVYLQPDTESAVIGTVEKGEILSLLYGGKMKRTWYHVCFKSEKTGATKSGYVLDSEVELLFDSLRSVTIQEGRNASRVEYPPRSFDEMHWGLTKKEVVEAEGKPAEQTKAGGDDVLVYKQQLIDLDCDIEYRFTTNKLYQTQFYFAVDPGDGNACLDDYRNIKDALAQKFGKPLEEKMVWRDNTYREDFSAWGTAVGLGQLELRSRWLTAGSEITARLAGQSQGASIIVLFTGLQSRDAKPKDQKEEG